jgi:hypothetical protein
VRPFCQLRPAFVQGARDSELADLRLAVRGLAQGCVQQAQQPSDRTILLPLGRARILGQNALLLLGCKADPRRAGMMRVHGGQPLPVEAADPGRDCLGVAASDQTDGSGPSGFIGNRSRAQARSSAVAGALCELLKRLSSLRSSGVSARRGSSRRRDMGQLATG